MIARRESVLGLLVLSLAACAGVAWGCGWDGFAQSVRFNLYKNDYDRQRLPPLPFKLRGDDAGGVERKLDDGDNYLSSEQARAETKALWKQAGEATERGELERARALFKEYAEHGDDTERMNSAADQLDALAALDKGSPAEHVRAYLEARRAYDTWRNDTEKTESHAWPTPTQEEGEQNRSREEQRADGMENWASDVETRLASIERDRELADNVAYLRAVGVYRAGQTGDAVKAFASVASRFARGEKQEAALFMAGKASMEQSCAYLPGETATSDDAKPDCRDEAWRAALENFSRVAAEYPRGRFAGDARGWLAYLHWRVGERADALVWYYRMLSDESDEAANTEALQSLRLARGRADEADMERVESALASEPRVALTYAYHEIYNYTQSYYFNVPEFDGEAADDSSESGDSSYAISQREKWRGEAAQRAERKGLARIARFASRMIERYPGARDGGAFDVRVAEANLELGEDKSALDIARRALTLGITDGERASALWVEGVAEYRLKDFAASRRTLARLVAEVRGGPIGDGARRLLAMVSEEAGDLDAALEQYLALHYDPDVSYFVDVLLSPEQLASFIERHPSLRERDVLLYSLGVRYLRAGRYAEARAALGRVRTLTDKSPTYWSDDEDDYYVGWYDKDHPPPDAKFHIRYSFWNEQPPGGERDTGVYADWVLSDLKTADDLERLEVAAARAEGDEAKAEALYQLAAYIYSGSHLKFYNPVLWRGARSEVFTYFDEAQYRLPGEAQTVWRYMQEHETEARALVIFLKVAHEFPHTRAARDALYSAAVCHDHLSNFNEYWRRAYAAGLHAGESMVEYEDVTRTYPGYRMPVGTNGWEPATRTVNGRAAWPAPPKPRTLTGFERARIKVRRAERRLSQGWQLFGEVGGGRVRAWTLAALRWLFVALVAACVLFIFRRTRRARRFLYRHLTRRRRDRYLTRHRGPDRTPHGRETYAPRSTVYALHSTAYAPRSSYAAHVPYAWGEGLRAAVGETAHGILRLALHERGRAALVLNLFTHGLLTVLLWAVLWAVKG
jgi:TolA-binding protein